MQSVLETELSAGEYCPLPESQCDRWSKFTAFWQLSYWQNVRSISWSVLVCLRPVRSASKCGSPVCLSIPTTVILHKFGQLWSRNISFLLTELSYVLCMTRLWTATW